jgi:hypothetical protein
MGMVATEDGARIFYKEWGSGPPSSPCRSSC